MKRICILLCLVIQASVWAKGDPFDPSKKNDFVVYSSGDTLWGTMVKNKSTGAGQPHSLEFLKLDGTILDLNDDALKTVESYSIGLGSYVFQKMSYFPEKDKAKKFYHRDLTYYRSWGILIYEFKSIAIVSNLKKNTIQFIEFIGPQGQDITPNKFYVFWLNGQYNRMNKENYKDIIIPHLKKSCPKMENFCMENEKLCDPIAPHPINTFKKLFIEFSSVSGNCKW